MMINTGESNRCVLFSQVVNEFLVKMDESIKQFEVTCKQPTTKSEVLDILFDKKQSMFESL